MPCFLMCSDAFTRASAHEILVRYAGANIDIRDLKHDKMRDIDYNGMLKLHNLHHRWFGIGFGQSESEPKQRKAVVDAETRLQPQENHSYAP
jgi:hypothetical protein